MTFRDFPALTSCFAVFVLVELAVCALAWLRPSLREHRAFLVYISFATTRSAALLLTAVVGSYFYYFYGYLYSLPVCSVLSLFVLCSAFARLFYPIRYIPRAIVILTSSVIAALIGAAAFVAGWRPPVTPEIELAFVRKMDTLCSLILFGCYWYVSIFSDYFAARWPRHLFGIVAGFRFMVSIGLASSLLRSAMMPRQWTLAANYVAIGGETVGCGIWLWYLSRRDSQRRVLQESDVTIMERWISEIGTETNSSRLESTGQQQCRDLDVKNGHW